MTSQDEINDKEMPLLDHLVELRNRLMYAAIALFVAFIVCYIFASDIYAFLADPLIRQLGPDQGLIYTQLTEVFFTNIKIAFFAGTFVSFPVIAHQVYLFVAPGLYKVEKKAFLPYLIAAPILFFLGGAMVYYGIFPLAWKFFLSFQNAGDDGSLRIEVLPRVADYLSLTMKLIFAFGLAFQLPVALTLLARVGIVSAAGLAKRRKYAVVGVFVVAALLTPPDIISQVGLAIPVLLLYEVSIWLARATERKRAAREAAEEAEEAEQASGA